MELNRKNMQKIFVIIVGSILVYLGLQNMNIVMQFFSWLLYVLMPFIIAGCCTFFLNVPLIAIEKRLFRSKDGKPVNKFKENARRPLSIVLSVAIFALIVGVFLVIIIPEIGKSITSLANSVPDAIKNTKNWADELAEENEYFNQIYSNLTINWDEVGNTVTNFLKNDAAILVSNVMSMLSSVVSIAVNLFLGVVLSFYILMRKEKITSSVKKVLYALLPLKTADFVVEVGSLTNQSFYNCITGQMMECVILGSLTALGMTIFGFPYAPLVGVMVAILSWIPMFGVGIGAAIGALFLLTSSPVQAFWFIIFMICLQQIEGNLIFPRVVGSNIGLPPILLISAIVLFSNFFGIVGLLVSGAVSSVLYTLIKRFVYNRLSEKQIPKEKYEVKTDFDFAAEKAVSVKNDIRKKNKK